jgi:hypothetical protein
MWRGWRHTTPRNTASAISPFNARLVVIIRWFAAVVIIGIGSQSSAQMRLSQYNDAIHAFAPDRSDYRSTKSFCQAEARAVSYRMRMAAIGA